MKEKKLSLKKSTIQDLDNRLDEMQQKVVFAGSANAPEESTIVRVFCTP